MKTSALENPHPSLGFFARALGVEVVFSRKLVLKATEEGVLRAEFHSLPLLFHPPDSFLSLPQCCGDSSSLPPAAKGFG